MKKKIFAPGCLFILLYATACNNGTSSTTTDSTSVTTGSTQTGSSDMGASNRVNVHFDPSASYVDLKTGKPVKLRVDTVTKYIIDEVTNQPVMYYLNPATNDTFDQRGRVVSHALVRSSDGNYSVDESRLTDDNSGTSSSSNMSSPDSSGNSGDTSGTMSGNSKTKIKDDKFKQKTDTTNIKIKNDKVKIKTKAND